jgi:hypothetical protein
VVLFEIFILLVLFKAFVVGFTEELSGSLGVTLLLILLWDVL